MGGVDDFMQGWGEAPQPEREAMPDYQPATEYKAYTKRRSDEPFVFVNQPKQKQRTAISYMHVSGSTMEEVGSEGEQRITVITSWCIITITGQRLEGLQQDLAAQNIGNIWCYDAGIWAHKLEEDAALVRDVDIVIPSMPAG